MTREDIKKLLFLLTTTFPNFKIEDKTATIDAWAFWLEEYDAQEISTALKAFVTMEGAKFAPTPSELIAYTHKAEELTEMTEGEAWALVRRAIGRAGYYAEEEFKKLPQLCKDAVGGANELHEISQAEDFNESVEEAIFLRKYREAKERKKQILFAPAVVREKMLEIQRATGLLEDNNGQRRING